MFDNSTFNREKCESFLLRLRGKQRCSLSSLQFNITLEVLANAISYEKTNKQTNTKAIQNGKEEIKLSL